MWLHSWPAEAFVDVATVQLANFNIDCKAELKAQLYSDFASVHQEAVNMSAAVTHRCNYYQTLLPHLVSRYHVVLFASVIVCRLSVVAECQTKQCQEDLDSFPGCLGGTVVRASDF